MYAGLNRIFFTFILALHCINIQEAIFQAVVKTVFFE